MGGRRVATLGWSVARVARSRVYGGRLVVRVYDRNGRLNESLYDANSGMELDPVMREITTSEIVLVEGD